MTLAEKIIRLRKEQGWSQEELAHRLEVSRQAVSKWESMASVPDLDKILKLSQLFGVSTDYLLKDDAAEETGFAADEETPDRGRTVTMEEANAYLAQAAQSARRIALGVALCILSPVPLILLSALSEYGKAPIPEHAAGSVGVTVLLLFIAGAVALFVTEGFKLHRYEYLEKEPIALTYGVAGMVEAKKAQFAPVFKSAVVTGVTLCILSLVPLLLSAMGENEFLTACCAALLFLFAAAGVFLIVLRAVVWGSYARLLEEGDYTPENKAAEKRNEPFHAFYWCAVTALYLGLSFYSNAWHRTWIVWPVAAVLFAGLQALRTARKE